MKYLFFAATLFISSFLLGQNPLKKYPTSNYYFFNSRNMIFNSSFVNDEAVKKAFVDTKILSQENFEKAFKLAQINEYPDALNTIDKLQKAGSGLENKYKCYWIGRWTEFFPLEKTFRQLNLIWVPFDENSSIREDYKPKTKDGFYVIVKSVDMDSLPYSQPSMPLINGITTKLANKKLKPASKIQNIYNGMLSTFGNGMGVFNNLLRDTFNLSNDEIETISYNTSKPAWPELFNRTRYGDSATYATINKHNYYQLGTAIYSGNYLSLYWIPGNQNFSTEEKPKSSLGYFFVHRGEAVESKYLSDDKNIYYLNTAWGFKNLSSTESYTPSTFSFASVASVKNNVSENNAALNNQSEVIPVKIDAVSFPNGDSTKPNEGSVQHKIRRLTYMGSFKVWSTVDLNKEPDVKKTLKDKYNYSDKDCEIIGRLANENGYPAAIRQYADRKLNDQTALNFTFYEVAEVKTSYASYALLWAPLKENANLPVGLRPETTDGFYMFSYKDGLAKNKIGSYSGEVKNSGVSTKTVNGVTVATAKLERFEYKQGIMILYFGESRIVRNCYLKSVKFKKEESEESIANSLKAEIAGFGTYMYFEFKEGFDCISAEGYLLRKGVNKMSISPCR